MIRIEEALERILGDVSVLPAEEVPLPEADGRVLAEDLLSPRDVPPFDNSSMDGYALRAADTAEGEVALALNEVIAAGSVGSVPVRAGTASAIMTGAPVPEGADAVVMIEKTDGSQQGAVRVRGEATVGQSIRPRGGDVQQGARVLARGTPLGPSALGLAASLGFPTLQVVRAPRIAILSTGDEVVMPGKPLEPGQIYSSNNFALTAMARRAGAEVRDCGNASDDLDSLIAALRDAATGADAVCTTGGVSMGAFDYVRDAHDALGAKVDFWKVRMKPGKPLAFGRLELDGRVIPLFGLPGNPVSCMVNFLEYVRPWIRMSLGDPRPYLPVIDAVAGHDFGGRPSNRARLERVVLERGEGGWIARTTGSQSSGVLTSMVRGHGFLLIGIDASSPREGDRVRVQLYDDGFLAGAAPDFGW